MARYRASAKVNRKRDARAPGSHPRATSGQEQQKKPTLTATRASMALHAGCVMPSTACVLSHTAAARCRSAQTREYTNPGIATHLVDSKTRADLASRLLSCSPSRSLIPHWADEHAVSRGVGGDRLPDGCLRACAEVHAGTPAVRQADRLPAHSGSVRQDAVDGGRSRWPKNRLLTHLQPPH